MAGERPLQTIRTGGTELKGYLPLACYVGEKRGGLS